MKTLFKTVLALVAGLSMTACDGKENGQPQNNQGGGQQTIEESLKIMSFNIRTGTSDKGTPNAWDTRKKGVFEMLKTEKPMIVGLQEARKFQRTEILAACPDYDGFGVCRDTGKDVEGETGSVIYNKNLCSVEKYGYFWLTEKDTSVPNYGWDADYRRMATWAVVKVKATGKKFFFINTHLDHKGAQAQSEGLKLVLAKFKELNKDNLPCVLTGDFNVVQTNSALNCLNGVMDNARTKASKTDSKATFNNWGSSSKILDYIFLSGFTILEYKTLDRAWSGVSYISDHYPIYAIVRFK